MMHPTSAELVEWAMRLRALNHPAYLELGEILSRLREHHRDRTVDGPPDNGLTQGFARGVSHIHQLITQAPKLLEDERERIKVTV